MKHFLAPAFIFLALTAAGIAADNGPDIRIVDNKVTVQADTIPLGRFLRLWDEATGMTSKAPPELANRNISVRFNDLNFDEAVHKIFEGQPLDYVLIQGKGIVVTGVSQTLNTKPGSAPSTPQETVNEPNLGNFPQQFPQPAMPGVAGVPGAPPAGFPANAVPGNAAVANGAQNQPAMIQTPFGAIPNPRANQPQGISPAMTPGQPAQQNPFNSTLPGFNAPSQLPGLQSNPAFGSPGTTPAQPPNPFNTSPFNTNPTQPRPNP